MDKTAAFIELYSWWIYLSIFLFCVCVSWKAENTEYEIISVRKHTSIMK